MNALDKIKNVTNGLSSCGSYSHLCSTCPYNDGRECERELHKDALEVINALRAELKKRTVKVAETKPGFIVLTAGVPYRSDGRLLMIEGKGKVAIRVDDILAVSDLVGVRGSEIRFKDIQQTTFCVCETLEEILGKIADMKGE